MASIVQRFVLVFAVLFGLALNAHAERRVALVIGNSAYQHVAQLKNPKNDAADLDGRLKSLGFEMFGGTDLDMLAMRQTLIEFGRAAETADVAVFFYAGHGLQIGGINYIVPVDAKLEFESEKDFWLVSLNAVMQQMERGSRTNIVFLDACRDNPFAKQLGGDSRSAVPLKGLASVQTGSGTFIAYATAPDDVASDGAGRNSPFTSALLSHIAVPGQSIDDMMTKVRRDVIDTTGGKQRPWTSSSLVDSFAFAPAAETAAGTGAGTPGGGSGISEKDAFEVAESVGSCGAYEAYVRRFPDSFFADIAREKMKAACAAPATEQVASAAFVTTTRSLAKEGVCEEGPFGVTFCASSVLDPIKTNRYDPSMLFDGNRDTAWVEARPDDGVGETVTLHFNRERLLAGFEIINGYDKDQRTWSNNSRVAALEAATSDGTTLAVSLQDVRGSSKVEFNAPVRTSWLQLRIDGVFRGEKFRDTAISELYPIFAD
ncbi:MAG: caspase family protein [Rhizobiaceae bacterium]|nr:caspase family protein [Rhizobiaceae bacterium]